MDYVDYLVGIHKNNSEEQLIELFAYALGLKKQFGESLLCDKINSAISFILQIKPKKYVINYNKLKRKVNIYGQSRIY